MKIMVLLFAVCIGSGLALQDALSGMRYKQEVIYINQACERMPGPAGAPATAARTSTASAGKMTFNA